MLLTRSSWLKALVAAVAGVVVVWFFQATMFDAQYVSAPLDLIESRFDPSAPPSPGARLAFAATAYCKGQLTFSGVNVQRGVTAADPALLPIGSVVQLDLKDDRYTGIYTVLDTGPAIQGREIDLFMSNCAEAQRFGRRSVRMTVLRLGWDPKATTRSFMDRFLRKATAPAPQPVEPPAPQAPPAQPPDTGHVTTSVATP